MPAVTRLGDMSTGHGCFPPTAMILTPVSKTYFNGILAGVMSTQCQFETHSCPPIVHPASERFISSGASKTYIEGYKAARIGDSIDCGDAVAEGSSNTFIE